MVRTQDKNTPCCSCGKDSNLTSATSKVTLENGNDKGSGEEMSVPGLQESMLCLSNIALHGVIVSGLLVWAADIKRRTNPVELWKAGAIKHFTKQMQKTFCGMCVMKILLEIWLKGKVHLGNNRKLMILVMR